MPLTTQQAAQQIKDAIAAQGKFNIGNIADALIGVTVANVSDLQAMLNELLKKKGVLSANDEAALKQLLDQQEAERKKRQQIRVKNIVMISIVGLAIGGIIYFSFNKK